MENNFCTLIDSDQSAVCPACGCPMTPMLVRNGPRIVYRCAPDCRFSGRNVYRERGRQGTQIQPGEAAVKRYVEQINHYGSAY